MLNNLNESRQNKYSTVLLIFVLVAISTGIVYFQIAYAPKSGELRPAENPAEEIFDEVTEKEMAASSTIREGAPSEKDVSEAAPIPYQSARDEISRGNTNKKQVIFTFDGGSGVNSADKILQITKKHNLNATFFVTGEFAKKYPEAIKKIALDGHEIFNHTYSHPHLTQITDEEIKEEFEKTENIVKDLTGLTTKPYFRPPYGDRNQHVLRVAASLGYQSVYWSTDALDWMTGKTDKEVKNRIYSNLKPGAIILMHIGDDITGNVLDEVFTYIQSEGYTIVSLTDGLK